MRSMTSADHRAVLELNERNVELLSPLDEPRLSELVAVADNACRDRRRRFVRGLRDHVRRGLGVRRGELRLVLRALRRLLLPRPGGSTRTSAAVASARRCTTSWSRRVTGPCSPSRSTWIRRTSRPWPSTALAATPKWASASPADTWFRCSPCPRSARPRSAHPLSACPCSARSSGGSASRRALTQHRPGDGSRLTERPAQPTPSATPPTNSRLSPHTRSVWSRATLSNWQLSQHHPPVLDARLVPVRLQAPRKSPQFIALGHLPRGRRAEQMTFLARHPCRHVTHGRPLGDGHLDALGEDRAQGVIAALRQGKGDLAPRPPVELGRPARAGAGLPAECGTPRPAGRRRPAGRGGTSRCVRALPHPLTPCSRPTAPGSPITKR